jgi:hypothetical protein
MINKKYRQEGILDLKYLPKSKFKVGQDVKIIRCVIDEIEFLCTITEVTSGYIRISGIMIDLDDEEPKWEDIYSYLIDLSEIGRDKDIQVYLIPKVSLHIKDFKEVF